MTCLLATSQGGLPVAISVWATLPFGILLAMIATMPFLAKHWWEHHYPKVAVVLGALSVGYYLFVLGDGTRVAHTGIEYLSFMALIGSLFVVASNIHIRVKGEATPVANCVFLLFGAVLANVVGTTGASMLLIRPWIRMNRYRITAFHVVFFIFIVSNVAGSLTPVGDPPLFLGYLKGIPFWWELQNLLAPWACAVVLLLALFFVLDWLNFRRAPRGVRNRETAHEEWAFQGGHNVLFLAVVLGAVFLPTPYRELLMVAASVGAFWTTSPDVRTANEFSFGPIKEVGWLFLGIFATMIPALHYLEVNAEGLGLDTPLAFYWFTGALSSVLDNAPTYLTFLTASVSQQHSALDGHVLNINNLADMTEYIQVASRDLMAISLGAVFYGAMTYIGNGPNFMVKAIAESADVHVPSFFGYILRYSLPMLLPILALVGWIFLR